MSDLPKISMWCNEGSHDKVYNVGIEECTNGKKNGYLVNFSYGRRGKPLLFGTKTAEPVGIYEANNIYNKLVNAKKDKGYKVTGKGEKVAKNVIRNVSEEVPDMEVVTLMTSRRFNFGEE